MTHKHVSVFIAKTSSTCTTKHVNDRLLLHFTQLWYTFSIRNPHFQIVMLATAFATRVIIILTPIIT